MRDFSSCVLSEQLLTMSPSASLSEEPVRSLLQHCLPSTTCPTRTHYTHSTVRLASGCYAPIVVSFCLLSRNGQIKRVNQPACGRKYPSLLKRPTGIEDLRAQKMRWHNKTCGQKMLKAQEDLRAKDAKWHEKTYGLKDAKHKKKNLRDKRCESTKRPTGKRCQMAPHITPL
eukprot:6491142-Amphidinium_carterae.4